MRGGAQSHLIEGKDGHQYVVKFLNNPQHRRILVNEWLSGVLLGHLQIHTPQIKLIQLSEDFIAANPELCIMRGSHRESPMPGLHFGSQLAVNPDRVPIYDFLPSILLAKIANVSDFLGALVFDKWVCNTDSRQAVFFRARAEKGTPLKRDGPTRTGFFVQMIDHGLAFNGPHWAYQDSPIYGIHFRTSVYDKVRSLDSFEPWLGMVQHLPVEIVYQAWKEIPPTWLDGDEEELSRLLEQLLKRGARVEQLILDTRKHRPATFPNWK